MSLPAIIAIGFTILAVPLFLKAAFAKPTPRQNLGASGSTESRRAAPSSSAPRTVTGKSDSGSSAPPTGTVKPFRWEIAMAESDYTDEPADTKVRKLKFY